MNGITVPTKIGTVERAWHLRDARGKTLGRFATEIAQLLMGKSKPYFVRNLDCGDYVVITNAKDVNVTGKKEEQKTYVRHSGYPGGYRSETLRELRERKPEEIIRHAVKGMLPDNKLAASMMKRLFIFSGEQHTYNDKFKS